MNYDVDLVITHCAPQSIADKLYDLPIASDKLTLFFDDLMKKMTFKQWFFGHYHEDRKVDEKFYLLYDQIIRIA